MKTIMRKVSIVLGIVLITGLTTSCNKKKSSPTLATNEVNINFKKAVTKKETTRNPLVFITGIDKGDKNFYKSARNYFLEKKYEVVDYAFSMQEIFTWLNKNHHKKNYGEIHIVVKSNPWKGLALETVINGEMVTAESLRKVLTQGKLPNLNYGITSQTKIIFHSHGLSSDAELIKTLKDAFVGNEVPMVVASPYYSIFDGEFSNHYLAKPFYGFYPTAQSPGNIDLAKEMARKYPDEKKIDWYDALNNEKERFVGDLYTYKFNIPVKWEFDYTQSDQDIPSFTNTDQIMDWIENDEQLLKVISDYKIPLDKFRWKAYTKGSKLIIKGKTTVVCVLQPLIKPYGDLQHVEPDVDNLRLYALN